MKRLLVLSVLSVCSFAIANAKTYSIVLANPTMAGSVQLKAGEYKVKVNGSNAVFTEVNSDKSVTAPTKVENSDKKYDQTTVQTTNEGGSDRLTEIDLGGSTTKLSF